MKSRIPRVPLHEVVAESLRKEVASLEPGTRIKTEAELAKAYDVSLPTFRTAVSILCNEGLLIRRQGSGTYVSSPPKESATVGAARSMIGVSINTDLMSNPCAAEWHFRVLERLLAGMDAAGIKYRPLMFRESGKPDVDSHLEFIQSGEAAGLFLMSPYMPGDVLAEAAKHQVHCVSTSTSDSGALATVAAINYENMTRLAADIFKSKGRRKVGLMAWTQRDIFSEDDRLNRKSLRTQFLSVMGAAGLETKEAWLCTDLSPADSASGWSSLREIWTSSANRPDALLVTDSKLLPGMLQAANDLRISLPDQLYVLSHSNEPECLTIPSSVARLQYSIQDWVEPLLGAIVDIINHKTPSKSLLEVVPRFFEAESDGESNSATVRKEIKLRSRIVYER